MGMKIPEVLSVDHTMVKIGLPQYVKTSHLDSYQICIVATFHLPHSLSIVATYMSIKGALWCKLQALFFNMAVILSMFSLSLAVIHQ
jgi:hypothetical protein